MIDWLGHGIFGAGLPIEITILAYVLITLRPGFPYTRVVSYAIGFYLILVAADFLGLNWVHYLVENIWQFIGKSIASVF